MKKRKPRIRIGRIIIAVAIYLAIGIIPFKLSHIRIDQAKSELAQELLAKNNDYPAETQEILVKSAEDPSYARDHIHVWDPDGKGGHPYDSYIGGGIMWHEKGYIVPCTGEKAAKVILENELLNTFLYILSITWLVAIPSIVAYIFILGDDTEKATARQISSNSK
jgi:hypothetical protein